MGSVGELRFGYDLDTIDRLAEVACTRAFTRAGSFEDRKATAYFGIVEHLYEATEAPDTLDLVKAGSKAVLLEAKAHRQTHGIGEGGQVHNAFARYWSHHTYPSPEALVVDRLAMRQILPMLTHGDRQAVYTLALFGDYAQAADALHITTDSFGSKISDARKHFFRWWYEGETPPIKRHHDRRVGRRAA